MRKFTVIIIAVVALAVSGCKSKCRQLSEKLCDCTSNSTDKTSCLTAASTHESNNPPSETAEATCAGLLDGCDCRLVDTPLGKVKCGLARPFGNLDGGT